MIGALVATALLQVPVDTVVLDVASALRRGLEASPVLAASRLRAEAAESRSEQTSAWPNPSLLVAAENVGQQRQFTGRAGLEGLEGQVVLRAGLPIGPERSGAVRVARAEERIAAAAADERDFEVHARILAALGRHLRDRSHLEGARIELETLSRLADALARQAQLGRAATGDAARATLTRGMASTQLGRREATLARGDAELARLLGYPPGTALRIELDRCERVAAGDAAVGLPTAADARAEEAAAAGCITSRTWPCR